jgi:hypothetical protein
MATLWLGNLAARAYTTFMGLPGPAGGRGLRTAALLALAMVLAVSSVARAVPFPPALSDSAARGADLAAIARVLESRLVAAHLRTLGLTPEAIQTQLARLDDVELHRMVESLPEVGLGGEELQTLTAEQKAGLVLLLLVALLVVGGLVYLALSGPLF